MSVALVTVTIKYKNWQNRSKISEHKNNFYAARNINLSIVVDIRFLAFTCPLIEIMRIEKKNETSFLRY